MRDFLPSHLSSTPHRIAYRWGYYLRKYFVAAVERRRASPETAKSAREGGGGGNKHILLLVYHFIVSISRASLAEIDCLRSQQFSVYLCFSKDCQRSSPAGAAARGAWVTSSDRIYMKLYTQSPGIINISLWGSSPSSNGWSIRFPSKIYKAKAKEIKPHVIRMWK